MALAGTYPLRTETQIITELLNSALDELVAAFPYANGKKFMAEDEYDDLIYEDAGLPPVFLDKTNKFLRHPESASEKYLSG